MSGSTFWAMPNFRGLCHSRIAVSKIGGAVSTTVNQREKKGTGNHKYSLLQAALD
jgi:hypothetical protein